MSDLVLRAAVCTQVTIRTAPRRLGKSVVAGAGRVADRLQREQTGQDLIEYGGILIIIAAIIAALISIGIPGDISTVVKNAVNSIIGSSAPGNAKSGATST
jgi:Flp pilus assembly pilin Flp